MEPVVAAAAMILLSCSPDMVFCHPAQTQPVVYPDIAACTAALPRRLQGTGMIGQCRAVDGTIPMPGASADASLSGQKLATVRVTRGTGPNAVSTDYLVLHAPDEMD
ncbi:hypothetical protein LJR234_003268 [Mesorhizobium amorphae]|uniref:hypothetical protein n=1 Tax=Mesorhizobium amorphae TaxID=71433 RepID=UPI003ECFEAF7